MDAFLDPALAQTRDYSKSNYSTYFLIYDTPRERDRQTDRDRETETEKDRDRHRERETETVSKLVFYAHSTSAVISG